MSRESRILVTLVVIGFLGVAGLMVLASQYKKSIARMSAQGPGGSDASIRAIRLVEGYLSARRAVRAVVERHPELLEHLTAAATVGSGGTPAHDPGADVDAIGAYRTERWNAYTARGLTYDDYALVRASWRAYREGGTVEDPALVAVFRARRAELEGADLGPAEPLDDAIK